MRAFFLLICLYMMSGAADIGQVKADSALPPLVARAFEDAKESCDKGDAKLGTEFLTKKDVNGDGVADYILDYGRVTCGDSTSTSCGTAGCFTEVYVSTSDGSYVKVLSENVRDLRFRKIKGRSAMLIGLHGSACGRIGAEPCGKTLYWNGTSFSPAH